MVFVSHRLAEVLEISTRVTVLRDGKLVGVYPDRGNDAVPTDRIHDRQDFRPDRPHHGHRQSPIVLAGRRPVAARATIEDVSLTIRRGETLGLTGLLGAGRTELALSIFGMLGRTAAPSRSTARPLDLRSNRDAIRAGIGYLSEDRLSLGLIQQQSIADNMVPPVLDKILNSGGLISYAKKAALGPPLDLGAGYQDRRAGRCDLDAFGRKSATRRDRQMAGCRPQAHHSRFTHRGCRRRRPRRHIRDRRANSRQRDLPSC